MLRLLSTYALAAVIGGHKSLLGEGIYYVRIDAGRRIDPLRAAARKLRTMRQVVAATPIYTKGR
jgi:hypothetical protein